MEKFNSFILENSLSRDEMSRVIAGSGGACPGGCSSTTVSDVEDCFDNCYSGAYGGLNCICYMCCMANKCGTHCA